MRVADKPRLSGYVVCSVSRRAGRSDEVEPCADTAVRVLVGLGLRRRVTRVIAVLIAHIAVPQPRGRQISKRANLISASRFYAALARSPPPVRALHAAVVRPDAPVP